MPEAPAPSIDDRDAAELALLDSLVTSIVDTRAAIAALQAFELTLLASAEALADEQTSRIPSNDSRAREMPRRSIAAEIGTAVRVNDRTVQRRLAEASALARDFPRAIRALGEGRIDRAHVSVIFETGGAITDAAARADFENAAVACAERETPGRLRPLLRTLAARLDPVSIDDRHARASAGRGVWVADLDDGMAQLIATLPATLAHAIHDRLTRLSHAVIDARTPVDAVPAGDAPLAGGAQADAASPERDDAPGPDPDRRTVGQVRADVLADLLLTSDPSTAPITGEPIRAHVQVTVPVLTLIGAGRAPAELACHGPIDATTARHLAGAATGWDRVLTHPAAGAVLAVDRYRPSEDQRRLLRARDEHCRFPGCRMPTARCDIDHTIDAARGGPTDAANLAHLCRRHHSLKHASAWRVRQVDGGRLDWTSPTGRSHADEPAGTVRFRASGDPPPF
ncbi:HNH endonuclease signature motif containing protein [Microbacterium sp. CFBP9034]|uniref:HNH endonuclease signature motif containing protein n=1 Tax=Microbacterium sp. CFBP9034 TaxID=3096540 RepID=UPI002A69BF65|nr:DUF222 domain-containing protein [Microbacterium sp. CFBP9034]MDY0908654.1 DUF222 domain-containing protein [Microbacterium sp. CFBP9034]